MLKKSWIGLIGLLFMTSACTNSEKERPIDLVNQKRPNIVWISCEDLSPHLGCYGDDLAKTPNMDRLAQEGIRYTNAYTSAPVCAPCRSGIITGMYQTSIGSHHMRTTQVREGLPGPYAAVPPHYVKAFTEYLRAEGYYCTNNAKTDYQFSARNQPIPVTIWDESGRMAHYKNRPEKSQPFFAVFNITDTHESRNWHEPYATDPDSVTIPPYYPDIPSVRSAIARLYDNMAKMDSIAGNLIREIEESGLTDNTIIFFWSDHGDGLPRAKRWLYDSGTHIPLMVKFPDGDRKGTVDDRLISSIDLGPTVLSLAGVNIPVHMQGKAFLGTESTSPRKYVYSARDRFDQSYDMVRSVRDKRYLYIRNFYPLQPYIIWVPYRNRMQMMQDMLKLYAEDNLHDVQKNWFSSTRPPEELYDCENDPHQINNLAEKKEYQKILTDMSSELDSWQDRTKDMGEISEIEMVNIMWPNGVQPVTAEPRFIINTGDKRNMTESVLGGEFSVPVKIGLNCPTQGASIAYTFVNSGKSPWKLYTGPIILAEGTHSLRAKAIRYGYQESKEVSGEFVIVAN